MPPRIMKNFEIVLKKASHGQTKNFKLFYKTHPQKQIAYNMQFYSNGDMGVLNRFTVGQPPAMKRSNGNAPRMHSLNK